MSDINERQLRGMFHRDFIENFSGKRVSFDNYIMKIRSSPYIMSQMTALYHQSASKTNIINIGSQSKGRLLNLNNKMVTQQMRSILCSLYMFLQGKYREQ